MFALIDRHSTRVLALFTGFMALVFLGAYVGLMPTELKYVPYYDLIGHLALCGIWGYLLVVAFRKELLRVGRAALPMGLFIVVVIASVAEAAQSLSPIRTASFSGLACGLAGVACTFVLYRFTAARRAHIARPPSAGTDGGGVAKRARRTRACVGAG